MPELPIIRARELIRVLKKLGFSKHHQVGSHAQYKHADGRRTTVLIHQGKDIGKKMLSGIMHDIDITAEILITLLKK